MRWLLFPTLLIMAGLGLIAGRPQQTMGETDYRYYLPGLSWEVGPTAPNITASPTRTAAPTSSAPADLVFCTVVNVTDGDTIRVGGCQDAGPVRLLLIDTPEVFFGTECFGHEASGYTTVALLGKQVGLERDISDTDRFGRYLRYVWLGDVLFNEQIVRDGYAALVIFPPDVKYLSRIAAAEQEAQQAGRGLWPICGGVDAPGSNPTPTPTRAGGGGPGPGPGCDPSYPTLCLPPTGPDLDCRDIADRDFPVFPPDRHRFDGDGDGIGCET